MTDRSTPITVGETAPAFTLQDQNGDIFSLADHRGSRILLSFHPLAATGVCTAQIKALDAHFASFKPLRTVPVGISVDAVPAKKLWADSMELKNLRILSDFWPHGAVARSYGLFREKNGFSERANVIVDENGAVAWIKIYEISTLPDLNEVFAFLKK